MKFEQITDSGVRAWVVLMTETNKEVLKKTTVHKTPAGPYVICLNHDDATKRKAIDVEPINVRLVCSNSLVTRTA